MNLSTIRRNIFEPLQVKRSDSPILSYWRALERSQYLTLNELKQIQFGRLFKLWDFIWENNAFYIKKYRSIGLRKEDLHSVDDIMKFPIISKREIRTNSHSMISKGFNKNRLLNFKTGGSTGRALDIYITEECSELRNACARRHDRWTGWEPGEPIGALWGNPKIPKSFKEKLRDKLIQPTIFLDTMAVSENSVKQFAKEWEKRKPTLLFGHAHSIFILAKYIKDFQIMAINPKGILSTSMMLGKHERELIEDVFGIKVTDRYGCEEVSLIGCECEYHNGMHMNIEHLIIEFIRDDGSKADPDETGHIVITDLMNYAMPLIRYRVEDMGSFSNRTCPCGRKLPLMNNIAGRVADFLIKRDGTRVAGVSLIENTLTKIPHIDQMQIIQNRLNSFLINLVPSNDYNIKTNNDLIKFFKNTFGSDITIEINQVDNISSEKSGKFRFSICNLNEN